MQSRMKFLLTMTSVFFISLAVVLYKRSMTLKLLTVMRPNMNIIDSLIKTNVMRKKNQDTAAKKSEILCYDLLNDGTMDENKNWQPMNCKMYNYTKKEASACMKKLSAKNKPYLAFIGEARIRRLVSEILDLISTRPKNTSEEADVTYFVKTSGNKIPVDSLWRYEVDDKMIRDVENYVKLPEPTQPSLIIMGAALYTIMRKMDDSFEYQTNLTKLANLLSSLKKPTILWMWQQRVKNHYLYGNAKELTNNRIHEYNVIARHVFTNTNVHVWASSRILSLQYNEDYIDGIQQGPVELAIDAQMIVNVLCNKVMRPINTTCCL